MNILPGLPPSIRLTCPAPLSALPRVAAAAGQVQRLQLLREAVQLLGEPVVDRRRQRVETSAAAAAAATASSSVVVRRILVQIKWRKRVKGERNRLIQSKRRRVKF